jgi:CheY-like chemotaxis protein
LYFDPH